MVVAVAFFWGDLDDVAPFGVAPFDAAAFEADFDVVAFFDLEAAAVDEREAAVLAAAFLVATFLAAAFLVATFLAVTFFAVVFFAVVFLAVDRFDGLDFFLAAAIAVTPPGRT